MALTRECVETEPSSFEEVVQQLIWVDAMVEEYDSIVRNSVWDVVLTLENKSVVSSYWLYKVKQTADGSVEKHKVRFVARGFSQVKGIDYDETFSPVARLKEEVYIEQSKGFETFDHESNVCQLKRALYRLKKAPRAWYTKIDKYFTRLGFTKSEADANLYHIVVKGKLLIIVLYVGDLILTSDDQLIVSCKEDLAREFEMKDMGLMHYFFGIEVWQKDGELFVSQGKYTNEILRRFHMEKCKPMQTLLADLCYVVNQMSQVMVQPTKMFWKAAKHVLRYFRGTSQYGLWYRWTEGVKLQGFIDADWAGSPSDRKSTSGGIFNLRSTTVSWYTRKQRSVALSSTEAEYMAASQVTCEAIWMWKMLVGLFDQRMDPTVIYCDNQSSIKLSENPVFHDRSKHINIWCHHLRDCLARRIMLLQYISTKEQDVDILTKAFSKCKFEFHRDRIGVADNPFLVEREC
eukprot:PITA_05295